MEHGSACSAALVAGQLGTGRYSAHKVNQVFELVELETQFLVDVRDSVSSLPNAERTPLHASIVLQHIGVSSEKDVDELVSMFWRGQDPCEEQTLRADPSDTLHLLEEFKRERDCKKACPATPSTQATPTLSSRASSPEASLTLGRPQGPTDRVEKAEGQEAAPTCLSPRLGGASVRRLQALRMQNWCDQALEHGHIVFA